MPQLAKVRHEATLRRMLQALPPELFRARPVPADGYAGTLMSTGDVEGVDALLRDAEHWLPEMVDDDR